MSLQGVPETSALLRGESESSPMPDSSHSANLGQVICMLSEMVIDDTLPRNFRRGVQRALEELGKKSIASDIRVASAVGILGEMANDTNLPAYGRTSLWSVISRLESLP